MCHKPVAGRRKLLKSSLCVLASPGFMQVGPSRELFELWAPDSRNGLIITGYSVEGTPARVSRTTSGPFIGRMYFIRSFLYLFGIQWIFNCFPFHPYQITKLSLMRLKFRMSSTSLKTLLLWKEQQFLERYRSNISPSVLMSIIHKILNSLSWSKPSMS